MIVMLTFFLKYYDVNLIYLFIYLRRINDQTCAGRLNLLELEFNKHTKCSNHISKLN